jgi:hypothetical protein
MTSLITFQISESQDIKVVIDEQSKTNTYGYQAEGLHIFDEVEVKYIHNDKTIVLARDIVRYVVETFCNSLEMVLKRELLLERSLVVGKVGYFFSKEKYITADESDELEKKDDIFSQYWVWSSPDNIQTWLYNVDSKIYLEISQTYSWLFSDPEEDELYVSFEEYVNDYKPIAIIELEESLIRTWIDQCHNILHTMEKV